MPDDNIVHGACPHDCYDTCGLVMLTDGTRIKKISGDPDHPITRGFLCMKVNKYMDRLYHPDRVLHPLRRTGPKGTGKFERVGWDEALEEIGGRIREIVARHGGEAVLPYSFAGNMGVISSNAMDGRFFAAIGASQIDRTICTASGNAALRWVFGTAIGPDPEVMERARFIVLWGANPMVTNVHQMPITDAARRAGAEIWTIDPLRTDTAARYDRHLQLRLQADLALALGMGRAIIERGALDRELIARGDGFNEYLAAVEPWTLERTSQATGLPAAVLEEFAEKLTSVRPLMLRVGYGVQRQRRSAATVWAISMLSLLTGSWMDVGGGLLLSNGDAFPLQPLAPRGRTTRVVNMVQAGEAILTLQDPPIRALIVYSANPAATAPDQSRMLSALAREDLFTVVHEQMLTDTARWADFVLPAAMSMETWDIHTSYWHRYVQLNRPATPPAGESVSNPEFFRRLAKTVGLKGEEFGDDDISLIRQALATDEPAMEGITFERLLEEPVQRLRIPAEQRPFVDTPVPTPTGRFRMMPPPGVGVDAPVPHARHEEKRFHLLTPAERETIKSSFGNIAALRRGHPNPELLMAPEDMAGLGIGSGETVRVQGERGFVEMTVVGSPVPQPGTVVSYAVRWNHESAGRNVNQLTSHDLADYGGGATFYEAVVTVERLEQESRA